MRLPVVQNEKQYLGTGRVKCVQWSSPAVSEVCVLTYSTFWSFLNKNNSTCVKGMLDARGMLKYAAQKNEIFYFSYFDMITHTTL